MSVPTALVVALTSAAALALVVPDTITTATVPPDTTTSDAADVNTAPFDSTPATSAPDDDSTFALTVPRGFAAIIDDTGVLAVVVPAAWTDVDTAPLFLDDRLTPSILAATDSEAFVSGWVGAGASLIVTPFVTPDENIGRFTITSGCADGFTTRDFSAPIGSPLEGIDEGLVTTASGCGPAGTGTWTIAAVSDAAQSYSLVLVVQTPTDTAADREAVAFVVDHFGATPFAVPTDLGVPSTAVPATERSAPVH